MIFRKFRTFLHLNPLLRRIVLQTVVGRGLIHAGFVIFGVPRTQTLVARWAALGSSEQLASDADCLAMTLKAQRIVSRVPDFGSTCLSRSMALWAILTRFGIATTLRVGVRHSGSKIEGHAWIEYRGQPINETAENVATYVLFKDAASFGTWKRFR